MNEACTYRPAFASPAKRTASAGLVAFSVQSKRVVALPSSEDVLLKSPLLSMLRPTVSGCSTSLLMPTMTSPTVTVPETLARRPTTGTTG